MSVLWNGVTHIGTHREVIRLIVKYPELTEIALNSSGFAAKYLTPDYLVRGLTVAERASCFLHHYKKLHSILSADLFSRILREDIPIYEIREGINRFTVTVGLSRPYDEEGELSLLLQMNNEIIFVLAFTIVPGGVVRSPAAETLLITRLQGVKGASSKISDATRAMQDVAPRAMLFAALQGIAATFGIAEISAIPGVRQTSYLRQCAASFKEAYDDFFVELGMSSRDAGFYYASLPHQAKPLASIKHGHKLRTKKKRAFKQQVQLSCASFFRNFLPAALHS